MKVGLEIHATLNTKSKIFCSCSTSEEKPNTNICQICLGCPGSKPVLNKEVLKQGILLARALNFKVANQIVFSRKSYFYPDLSKNYQITQFEEPLGLNGSIKISDKIIRLKRIHLEEDPAQIIRTDKTLIDYNRSGMPLAEIVTEPDIETANQAREFMKKLSRTLLYLGITDNVKADVNISIKESGFKRVEVKNVTGFKEIERCILYEAKRQKKDYGEGSLIENATYGWDAAKSKTYLMRKKESEADYGYIYDPDLVPIKTPKELLQEKLPEFSDSKIARYTKLGVTKEDADIITMDPNIAKLFEEIKLDTVFVSKWFRGEILRVLNYNKLTLNESKFNNKNISELLELVYNKKINDTTAKKILEKLVVEDFDVNDYVKKNNLLQLSDDSSILDSIKKVIDENKEAVNDYLAGEEKSFNFLFGKVMRETKGKANPVIVKKYLIAELKK